MFLLTGLAIAFTTGWRLTLLILAVPALLVAGRGVPGWGSSYDVSAKLQAAVRLAGVGIGLVDLQPIVLYTTLHDYWQAGTPSSAFLNTDA